MVSHAPELVPDVLEKIFKGFDDLKEIVQFKRVCKSWYAFISGSRFTKYHVNRTYNIDRNNNELGHRRICFSKSKDPYSFHKYEVSDSFFPIKDSHLIGSCDGLVCISLDYGKVIVANPMTKVVRKLQNLPITYHESFCWGFGYDSAADDYKIVVGNMKGKYHTSFHVLDLKSNVWKDLGELKYSFYGRSGVLCNGALHWFMRDENKKVVILSFDLSTEEFKEIPQPDDERYRFNDISFLGVLEECLGIFVVIPEEHGIPGYNCKWVMRNYDGKRSWERMPLCDKSEKYDVAHFLRNRKDYDRIKKSFFEDEVRTSKTWEYIGAPIYVESIVSPHAYGIPNRKRRATESERSVKDQVLKFDAIDRRSQDDAV